MFRWTKDACPGSIYAEAAMPPALEEYASTEGTVAHWLAEMSIGCGVDAIYWLNETRDGVLIDEDMCRHVQGYVDYVRALEGGCRLIEWKFHLHEVHEMAFSTLDLAVIMRDLRKLKVADFKYGRVPVDRKSVV